MARNYALRMLLVAVTTTAVLAGCSRTGAIPTHEVEPSASFFPAKANSPVEPTASSAEATGWAVVPAGTAFEVVAEEIISTRHNVVGDPFAARIVSDLVAVTGVVVPAGSLVTGRVIESLATRKIGGRSLLGIEMERVTVPGGESYPLVASFWARGETKTRRDAATIGGATVGGAILGRILDRGDGAVTGGILGAAVGTAVSARRRGNEVEIAPGEALALVLEAPLRVEVLLQEPAT